MRRNQLLLSLPWPFVRCARSWSAVLMRMETGCLGGVPSKARFTLSRQNWSRRAPTCGVETVSATRAISRLKARIAM